MPPKYKIKELDLDEIRPRLDQMYESPPPDGKGGARILILGKSGTGKSTLIENILYNKKKVIPELMVYSGTEDLNHFYEKIISKIFIEYELNEKSIDNYLEHQKVKIDVLPDENTWSALVIDDLTTDPSFFKKEVIQRILKLGRHYKMMFLLVMHYCMDIPISIRNQFDGVFIMREPNAKYRRKIWEQLAGVIPTFNLFNEFMNQLTDDYSCIYIDIINQSNDFQDSVYYYKSTPVTFKWFFGSDTIRTYAINRELKN
jgi:hypothetical protein